MEAFSGMNKTVEKTSRCAGLEQAKEETSAPSGCFSMPSAAEQRDVLQKAHPAGRCYAKAMNANVLDKEKKKKEKKSFIWETTACFIDAVAARRPQRTENIMGLSSRCQEGPWRGLKGSSDSAPCPRGCPGAGVVVHGRDSSTIAATASRGHGRAHRTSPTAPPAHAAARFFLPEPNSLSVSRFPSLRRVSSKSEYICRN